MDTVKYILTCPFCSCRLFSKGGDVSQLREIKSAPLPLRADGKSREEQKRPRRFYCPQCSRCCMKIHRPPEEKKDAQKD